MYRVGRFLKRKGYSVEYDHSKDMPDIIARCPGKGKRSLWIEIEESGSNIDDDIYQGAEIFIVREKRKRAIEKKVKGRRPVHTLREFKELF
jgi:hypothetical protein